MLLEWQLKLIRRKEQKKLLENNLYLYKCITSYIQNSTLRGIEKEEILQQVMDMMLQAQFESRPMNLIIGQDYEQFCKSIIEEYCTGKNETYRALNFIQKYLLWMVLISLFMIILRELINFSFNFSITIDEFILANIISLIIIPVSRKNLQETSSIISLYQRLYTINRDFSKSETYALVAAMVILGLSRLILGKILGLAVFSYTIPIYTAVPCIILIFVIIGAVELYKRVYDRE